MSTVIPILLSCRPSKEVLVALKLRTGKAFDEFLEDVLGSFMFEPINPELFRHVSRVLESMLLGVGIPAKVSAVYNLADSNSYCVNVELTASACSQ